MVREGKKRVLLHSSTELFLLILRLPMQSVISEVFPEKEDDFGRDTCKMD